MREGDAAYVIKAERVGGRIKFELHHRHYISLGGQVYDIDNISVLTPRSHIALHQGGK